MVLAALLAGCGGPPNATPHPAAASPPRIVAGQGIDMVTDASDVLNEIKGAGIEFVGRYYRDPDSMFPSLSRKEALRLSALGLKIVAVYEYRTPDPAHFHYQGGYDDAVTASGVARGIGQPAGSALYFAVDFHAHAGDLPAILDYFRGVDAGLAVAGGGNAAYRVGVYGSGPVCDAVRRAGLASYGWLSNSITWDEGSTYDDWNIMQGSSLPGLSFGNDSDQARDDYGGFAVAP
jgi:Domain of unknown function (DUF1906)